MPTVSGHSCVRRSIVSWGHAFGPFSMILVLFLVDLAYGARYAVLVGNSTASGGYEKLRYVTRDLDELEHALTSFCDFESHNVIRLVDESPDRMLDALDRLSDKLGVGNEKHLFFFYYSGHADRGHLLMGREKLSFHELHRRFERFPGHIKIGVFDACQSGAFARAKGGRPAEPFLFREEENIEGHVILYSSSANENSQESDIYKNSVFTFHFVNALRGAGDVSGDGLVTLSEAYRYSYDHTVSSTARSRAGAQHPGYRFRIQGEGNIVLADLKKRTAGLLFAETLGGTFTITNDRNAPVAELSKKRGRALKVALSPGTYRVIRTDGSRVEETDVVIDTSGVRRVSEGEFRPVHSMVTAAKGERPFISYWAVEIGGALSLTDFSAVENGIVEDLAGPGSIVGTVDPRFPETTTEWFFNLELASSRGIWWNLGGRYSSATISFKNENTRTGPEQTGQFAAELIANGELSAFGVRAGAGYSPPVRILSNAAAYTGLTLVYTLLDLDLTFRDELFDQNIDTVHGTDGFAVAPYVGIRYRQPLPGHIAVSLHGEYRLSTDRIGDEPGEYTSSLGGFQAGASVAVLFGRNRSDMGRNGRR